MFDQYQILNAASKIDGYYSQSPTKSGGPGVEFERAKAECLGHLRQALACTEALTVDEFMTATRRGQAWARYQTDHVVTEEGLCMELRAYCDAHMLPFQSADELAHSDDVTEAQREWLLNFGQRWDAMQESGAGDREFTSDSGRFKLRDLLTANAEDVALCEWLKSAAVGEAFGGGAGATIKRIA